MPTPSTSDRQAAEKRPSHANFSTKSSGESTKAAAAALEVADNTFQSAASLPFESPAVAHGPVEGRRRLHGAFLIDIDRIEPDPNQPRKNIDPGYLDEIKNSISRCGVLQPISVRFAEESNRYRIIAGECRYRAAKAAGLQELPCWVRSPEQNEILVQQVVENWIRCDLSPFELADALAILRDANGYSQKRLAQTTGKSSGEISKLLALLTIDPDAQLLARGHASHTLSKRHLYAVSRLPASSQGKLIKEIIDKRLTATDVEAIAQRRDPQTTTSSNRCSTGRRSYRTSAAVVTFVFQSPDVADEDLLLAMEEIKSELTNNTAQPKAEFSQRG